MKAKLEVIRLYLPMHGGKDTLTEIGEIIDSIKERAKGPIKITWLSSNIDYVIGVIEWCE